jgi:NAD(P)-dependent dehydrogenase (short-subunit alcohol dehydrogenase family)
MTAQTIARRPLALVTGAGGGMGRACAATLGRRYRLILTDRAAPAFDAFADQLAADGVAVAGTVAGDIAAADSIARLATLIDESGGLDAFVHTAGVSPSLGDWQTILRVNLGATMDLLDAVEPRLRPGAVGVVIASMAAHSFHGTPGVDEAVETVAAPDVVARFEPMVRAYATAPEPHALGVSAYFISKYAVKQMCERRAAQWGRRGARLVTISPGMIATPMGLLEARQTPDAAGLAELAPVGRWGTPLDIAAAADFLLSDAASFISGCDLRVDGGIIPVLLGAGGVRAKPDKGRG